MIYATRSLWRIVWISLNFNDIVDQIILFALACFTTTLKKPDIDPWTQNVCKRPKSVFLRILNRLQLLPFSHMFMAVKNYFHPQDQKSSLSLIELNSTSTFSILYCPMLISCCWHLAPKYFPNMNNAHCDNICVSCQKVSLQIRSLQNESLQMWIQGFKGSAKRDSCLQGFLKSEEIRVKSNSLLKEFEEIHFLQKGSFRRDSYWRAFVWSDLFLQPMCSFRDKFVILTWQIFPLTKLLLFPYGY